MTSVDQLFDPALKGRVSVLSEMRDTMGILMAYQGADPSNFTDDEFNAAIELLTQQVDNGQIRQVTGNDYAGALESGDLIAVIGWSGRHDPARARTSASRCPSRAARSGPTT